jgi:hypothetical protein
MQRAGVNGWLGREGQDLQKATSFDELRGVARMYVDRGRVAQVLSIVMADKDSVGSALMCTAIHLALDERDPKPENYAAGVTKEAERLLARINRLS